jgi:hypothetical protein
MMWDFIKDRQFYAR